MLRLIKCWVFTLIGFCALGQEIKVVNEYSEPIENVEIYSSSKKNSITTSYKGIADLNDFKNSDTLFFFKSGPVPKEGDTSLRTALCETNET